MRILYHGFYSQKTSFKLKYLLSSIIVLVALLSYLSASAQVPTLKISGTVLDEKSESVIGATVLIKGTTKGTVTDVSGKFSLAVPDAGTIIIIRSLGYTPIEKKAGEIDGKLITLSSTTFTPSASSKCCMVRGVKKCNLPVSIPCLFTTLWAGIERASEWEAFIAHPTILEERADPK